jgi:DNA-binding MarR family transcriptional regulator
VAQTENAADVLPPGLRPLSADEESVMRALARVLTALPRALDADLLREQRMSLSEYLALMNLSEAPRRTLRASELAAACDMSLSGMTRLVAKLEADELVERVRCPSDGRVANVTLTDEGMALLRRAWPTNLASVRRHVFDHLGDVDLGRVARVLGLIASDTTPSARR